MKRYIILITVIFAAVLLAGAAWAGWLVWQRLTVPVFTFAQQPAPGGQLTNSFLSSNGVNYVMTRPEYSLELVPTTFGYPLIGRIKGDQDVRSIPGNDDYVFLTGFMYPAVIFRKESAPPVDLAALPVEQMDYIAKDNTQNTCRSTRDGLINAEVIERMQAPPVSVPQSERIYHLGLLSPELPGLIYAINVIVDASGAVYLAPPYDLQHGVSAGPLFTQWITP